MNKKKLLEINREKNFKESSLDNLMTLSYGAKGSFTRALAEIKIEAIAKNIAV